MPRNWRAVPAVRRLLPEHRPSTIYARKRLLLQQSCHVGFERLAVISRVEVRSIDQVSRRGADIARERGSDAVEDQRLNLGRRDVSIVLLQIEVVILRETPGVIVERE